MIFFILLIKGCVIALGAYAIGMAIALGLWLIGLIIRIKIPAFLRWGGVGVALFYYGFVAHPEILQEPTVTAQDWRSMAENCNKIFAVVACVALAVTGLILSLTKVAVKGVALGVKGVALGVAAGVQAATAEKKNRQEPPQLPKS